MLTDYHIHTLFSDGKGDLPDYVEEAAKREIAEIGFSDHIHFEKTVWSIDVDDLSNYMMRIRTLQKTSKISIKIGLEVDFVPHAIHRLMQSINKYNFDYLIGSVHYVDGWPIDDDEKIGEWKTKDVDQIYEKYYALVQEMARTGLFDIVGHLDLVKKYDFRPKKDIASLLLDTIEVINRNEMCIEINTSGLRRGKSHELYPSERLLKTCFDNEVPVTMGSDAHSPGEVGADFDKAIQQLKKVGYDQIVRFTERKREFEEL